MLGMRKNSDLSITVSVRNTTICGMLIASMFTPEYKKKVS
jgi:hypothetical protein